MKTYLKFLLFMYFIVFANQIYAQSCDQTVEIIDPAAVANLGACSFGGVSTIELNLVKFGLCKDVPTTDGVSVNLSSCVTIARNQKITVTLDESGITPDAVVEGKTDAESGGVDVPTASYSAVFLIVDNVVKHKGTVKFSGGVNDAASDTVLPGDRQITYCSTNGFKSLDNGQTTLVSDGGTWIDANDVFSGTLPFNRTYVGADCSNTQLPEEFNETKFISAGNNTNVVTNVAPGLDLYTLKADNITLSTPVPPTNPTAITSDMKSILLVTRLNTSLQMSNTSELLMRQNFSYLGALDVRENAGKYYLVSIDVKRGFVFEPSLR